MAAEGLRGTVGIVRPTQRTGGFEDLLRILPQGIRLIPLALDVQRGAIDEFQAAIPAYEAKVAALATMGVDVINPSGAPPFMVLGYAKEQELIRRWEDQYNTRVFTSGTSNIDAMRALKVTRILGATYFRGDINKIYGQYFVDAGFECLDMAGIDVDFDKVPELPSSTVYDFIEDAFSRNQERRGGLHARAGLAHARHHREAGTRPRRAGVPGGAGAMLGHPAPPRHPRAGARIWPPDRRDAGVTMAARRVTS